MAKSNDCMFLKYFLDDLNKDDNFMNKNNDMKCCGVTDFVVCDNNENIEKLDLSNYNIKNEMAFPPSIVNLKNIKEFSIRGQKKIIDIPSFDQNKLEKLDLSNTGLNGVFPAWITEAQNLKELYLINTKINDVPRTNFKSNKLEVCKISNSKICSIYQNNTFNFLPQNCKDSCSEKVNVDGTLEDSGSSSWPYILGGVVLLLIVLLAGGYFIIRNRKNNNKFNEYSNNNSKPILPIAKKDNFNNNNNNNNITPRNSHNSNINISSEQIINVNTKSKKMEEVARNNYSNAYGADVTRQSIDNEKASCASIKDIYRQHNASTSSFNINNEKKSIHSQQFNSMYEAINNQDEILSNSQEEEIIRKEIIGVPEIAIINDSVKEKSKNEPELLRRKSSKKSCSKSSNSDNSNIVSEEKCELYIANWDYKPTLSDELTLNAGDIIEIKKIFDDGWSTGLNRRTQQSGIIPMCYLKPYKN